MWKSLKISDEFYGISNNNASFPAQKFHSDQNDNSTPNFIADTKLIVLNSADELFCELRDKNFNAVSFITLFSELLIYTYIYKYICRLEQLCQNKPDL